MTHGKRHVPETGSDYKDSAIIRIKEAIVVEGRYDAARLKLCVDAPVFVSDGFGIFKNNELATMLRRVAERRGLIVLTDSDGAGLVIRRHISSLVPGHLVKHAYIPQVEGKERRKTAASKEGLLGVEGIDVKVLTEVLLRAGATMESGDTFMPLRDMPLTPYDLYELGLTGCRGSAELRSALLNELGFPPKMTAGRLMDTLNACLTRDGLMRIMSELERVFKPAQ